MKVEKKMIKIDSGKQKRKDSWMKKFCVSGIK